MKLRDRYPAYQAKLDDRYYKRVKRLKKYQTDVGCQNASCKWQGPYDPLVLEFAHIEPILGGVRAWQHVRTGTLHRIFKEIRRCRVLCANCHKIETDLQGVAKRRWNKTV